MKNPARENRPKRIRSPGNEGSAAIEFGLLVPLLVTLLLGCAEIGYFIQQTMMVHSAVDAGITLAAKRGFDLKAITNAVLDTTTEPGLQATPAPVLFCGCVAKEAVEASPCDATCKSDGLVPGHYVRVGAALKPRSILPNTMLPLPEIINAQSTIRLN